MKFINEPRISQLCYNMMIGITEPKFAILDNGTQVIVKLLNGSEGNLVLFNEYVCYRLALLLDIPMPHSGICVFDRTTDIQDKTIADNRNFGKAFYSEFMPKTTKLLRTIINQIRNKEDFIKILLFDHVILNTDRNPGNLLVSFYKKNISLKVIDHTHVFVNQAIWDSRCLRIAMNENDLLSDSVLKSNSYLYDMFFASLNTSKELLENDGLVFKYKINRDIIYKFIDEVPNEWKPPQNDVDALVDYIMYRVDNLDIIISTILSYT